MDGLLKDKELMEALAAVEHERWSGWMRHQATKGRFFLSGDMVIPVDLMQRWTRQMNTPYEQLSEEEKESDRREVRKTLEVIRGFLEKSSEALLPRKRV